MSNSICTAGHSNLKAEVFLKRISQQDIKCVVDVRSTPRSRWVPWANKDSIRELLRQTGIDYKYAGILLGGRPTDIKCMTNGRADYIKMADTEGFQRGLEMVYTELETGNVLIMCTEEDPIKCHRMLLITRMLRHDIDVCHFRGNGDLEGNGATESRMMANQGLQKGLFEEGKDIEWAYDEQGKKFAWRMKHA